MPRWTKADLFNNARTYLDTDELNFPNPLCDILLRRVWMQAVSMEREWRFLQKSGEVEVTGGTALVPFSYTTGTDLTTGLPQITEGTRIQTAAWGGNILGWCEYTWGLSMFGTQEGSPVAWTELNDGLQRNIRLFPVPSGDGELTVDFYLTPVYVEDETQSFDQLPEEFDSALLEGLLADMYMREEDPDLFDTHRQMFLEQMGTIKDRWRESLTTPLVMGGRGRWPGGDPGGFDDYDRMTRPVA